MTVFIALWFFLLGIFRQPGAALQTHENVAANEVKIKKSPPLKLVGDIIVFSCPEHLRTQ